ncbi:MAG TPA: DUF3465 domain-containing protein [Chitinispirillaceae bacterium]|nr:DUF3465 domain-containing protein [Chitinispirillaceae bacterium]
MKTSNLNFLLLTFLSLTFVWTAEGKKPVQDSSLTPLSVIEKAFLKKTSNIQVKQAGTIIKLLPDDNDGARHQKMIIKLENGRTLLISHNIDLAKRIPNPRTGKNLKFYGEYEWNSNGGVVHWTHKDPGGKHINGWLEYEGKKYQ